MALVAVCDHTGCRQPCSFCSRLYIVFYNLVEYLSSGTVCSVPFDCLIGAGVVFYLADADAACLL